MAAGDDLDSRIIGFNDEGAGGVRVFSAGVLARTTIRPARVPLVHQSFSPLIVKCPPSESGTANVFNRAGSLPTSVR